MFGKETVNNRYYSQEEVIGSFENSRFVYGAQGNKGVTIIGPGATNYQRPFGIANGRAYTSKVYRSAPTPGVPKAVINQQIKQDLTSLIMSNSSYVRQSELIDQTAARWRNFAVRTGQNYIDNIINRY